MKAIVLLKTYKTKQAALSVCSHILREHGHPIDKTKGPLIAQSIDRRDILNEPVDAFENSIDYKKLHERQREIQKQLAVYIKREQKYRLDGKEKIADKQKVKISELELELNEIVDKITNFSEFAKTASKKKSVKYIELEMIWTKCPPSPELAKKQADLSYEFLSKILGEDFIINNAVVQASHLDQSSMHQHIILRLDDKLENILRKINPSTRYALSDINKLWSDYCKNNLPYMQFEDVISGNKYLKLNDFKIQSEKEKYQPLALTKLKITNLKNTSKHLQEKNERLEKMLETVIKAKQNPALIQLDVPDGIVDKFIDTFASKVKSSVANISNSVKNILSGVFKKTSSTIKNKNIGDV